MQRNIVACTHFLVVESPHHDVRLLSDPEAALHSSVSLFLSPLPEPAGSSSLDPGPVPLQLIPEAVHVRYSDIRCGSHDRIEIPRGLVVDEAPPPVGDVRLDQRGLT